MLLLRGRRCKDENGTLEIDQESCLRRKVLLEKDHLQSIISRHQFQDSQYMDGDQESKAKLKKTQTEEY